MDKVFCRKCGEEAKQELNGRGYDLEYWCETCFTEVDETGKHLEWVYRDLMAGKITRNEFNEIFDKVNRK